MTQEHPITPPPELVQEWLKERTLLKSQPLAHTYLATRAAQWGADQELEACRMEIIDGAGLFYIDETSDRVRLAEDIWTARRPKPPSLKEQALKALDHILNNSSTDLGGNTIRRALEQLPDHEPSGNSR
jgi:hypothetical protein